MAYNTLSRAQLSFEYLHTNSTTHEFLFGALAELLDNARDASATKINIYTLEDKALRGGYMLCFLDDGEGMDPGETADIITFGKSSKRSMDNHQIGMYGNGLKSGSMRIGNDLILFTKKGLTMSCLFLSRTFHEEESIDEVIVPMPTFDASSRRSLIKGNRAQEKHDTEMNLIYKYSPFRSEEEFFAQFDKIEGNSGTLVIVFNMKLLDSGETELDIHSDPNDILLTNPESDFDSDEGLVPEKRSFRAYTAILYMDPRMRIYIQNKKVRTKKLSCCLYKPKMYRYSSNRFKARSENEAKKSQEEAVAAENKARESESKAKNYEVKIGNSVNRDQRAELRKLQNVAAESRRDAQIKKQISERKNRALKDPKTLNLIFGLNLENRSHDGVFVYNCSRLIKMYEKVGPQTEGGVNCSGVVGIVDVPYLVLEPTHNKQDFADAKEYRHLMKAMGEHMVQFWKDLSTTHMQQGVTKFWENFGYISTQWKDPPSSDMKFLRKRAMQLNVTLQCDMCLKWRTLPFSSSYINCVFPDDWVCAMNPDQQHNKCATAEQKLNLTEGFLKKETKTQEQKKKELEEEIRKNQEKLEKITKTKQVTSSKQLRDMEREKKRQAEEKEKERRQEQEERERERINQQRIQRQIANLAKPSNNNNSVKKTPEPATKSRSNSASSTSASSSTRGRRAASPPPKKEAPKPSTKATPPARTGARTVASVKAAAAAAAAAATAAKSASAAKTAEKRSAPIKEPETKGRGKVDAKADGKADARKRRASSTANTADEEEEEEEEVVPVKKGRQANQKSVQEDKEKSAPEPTPAKKQNAVEDNEADATSLGTEDSMETEDSVLVKDADSNGEIGQRVEAMISNKWYPGVIVKVNTAEAKWKVKFDNNTKDKYDKWYDKEGTDIRMIKTGQAQVDSSSAGGPQSPASLSNQDGGSEAPTSSTTTPTPSLAPSAQATEDIANGYRTCLRYFLPPQWVMDKESISSMSVQDLAQFPLDDFFDHYEKGLRRLVSNFQNEAAMRKSEAEEARTKLTSVRKLIVKLLKSIHEQDLELDVDTCGDQVDEMLEACVRQAEQSQN